MAYTSTHKLSIKNDESHALIYLVIFDYSMYYCTERHGNTLFTSTSAKFSCIVLAKTAPIILLGSTTYIMCPGFSSTSFAILNNNGAYK